jgi:hypothetical protein
LPALPRRSAARRSEQHVAAALTLFTPQRDHRINARRAKLESSPRLARSGRVVAELATSRPDWHIGLRGWYPGSRQTCDLLWGKPIEGAIEIKMFRPNGDNGKPDDTAIKDILSPFASDRSALSDCRKLASTQIAPRRAILIYAFDDRRRPLREMEVATMLSRRRAIPADSRGQSKGFDTRRPPQVIPSTTTTALLARSPLAAILLLRPRRLRRAPRLQPRWDAWE